MSDRHLSRRSFFWYRGRGTAGAFVPATAFAAAHAADALGRLAPERSLSFFHTHTQERLTTTYCFGGRICQPARSAI